MLARELWVGILLGMGAFAVFQGVLFRYLVRRDDLSERKIAALMLFALLLSVVTVCSLFIVTHRIIGGKL